MVQIQVTRLTGTAQLPQKKNNASEEYLVYSDEVKSITVGNSRIFSTGLKVDVPDKWQLVFKRPPFWKLNGTTVETDAAGKRDIEFIRVNPDPDELKLVLFNDGDATYQVGQGEVIAIMQIVPIHTLDIEDITP